MQYPLHLLNMNSFFGCSSIPLSLLYLVCFTVTHAQVKLKHSWKVTGQRSTATKNAYAYASWQYTSTVHMKTAVRHLTWESQKSEASGRTCSSIKGRNSCSTPFIALCRVKTWEKFGQYACQDSWVSGRGHQRIHLWHTQAPCISVRYWGRCQGGKKLPECQAQWLRQHRHGNSSKFP